MLQYKLSNLLHDNNLVTLKNDITFIDFVVPVQRKLEKRQDSVGTATMINQKMVLQTGVKNLLVHVAQVRLLLLEDNRPTKERQCHLKAM